MFWDIFENLCNNIGKKPSPVGKEIGVSATTISKWKAGAVPNSEILLRVADYFDVSTDYLLDRTVKPTANSVSIIKSGDITGNNNRGNTGNVNVGTKLSGTEEAEQEINSILSRLNPRERTELMMMIYHFSDQCKEKSRVHQGTYQVQTVAFKEEMSQDDND
ncbi:MAG: helix-turn-helix domain-containing protein [Oscillospiraceae bacterium]|nr:helix-turn-helix domain-containing protein [Oscillospiraceae bacterium]